MSSNEELAVLAKSGDKQAINELWEQVRKLCGRFSFRYINKYPDRCNAMGITEDDLMQECYFAVLNAVYAYKPESGYKFNTYLNRHVMNRFAELSGCRTERTKNEPLNHAGSLDATVQDMEGVTIAETIADDTALNEYENAIEREYNRQLHIALDECMKVLTSEQKTAIIKFYYKGMTRHEVCTSMGITLKRFQSLQTTALTKMFGKGAVLLSFAEDTFSKRKMRYAIYEWSKRERREKVYNQSLHGTGYNAFRCNQASIVERIAEQEGGYTRYSRL